LNSSLNSSLTAPAVCVSLISSPQSHTFSHFLTLSTMGNNVSRFDDAETEPDYAMEEGGDAEAAWACLQEKLPAILRLEDCARSAEEMAREREEMKRQSHNRTTDLWTTIWGRLLLNPNLNEPSSWEHRTFMRRFRLPYQLFKQASFTVYSALLILHLTILSTHFI
jgi:hypothetical protein